MLSNVSVRTQGFSVLPLLTVLVTIALVAFGFEYLAAWNAEKRLTHQINEALKHTVTIGSTRWSTPTGTLVFDSVDLKPAGTDSATGLPFTAGRVRLDIELDQWLGLGAFSIVNMNIHDASMTIRYLGGGKSNLNALQESLRSYIASRRAQGRQPVNWNIDTADIQNLHLTIVKPDGDHLASVVLPHVQIRDLDSSNGGKANTLRILAAIQRAIIREVVMGNGSGQIDIEALLRLELNKGVPRLLQSEKFQNIIRHGLQRLAPKAEFDKAKTPTLEGA